MSRFFNERSVLFADSSLTIKLVRYLLTGKSISCVIWSFKDKELALSPSIFDGMKVVRVEDGFIRSVGRGIDHNLPWSLCLDSKGMYFDASSPSDLEDLCNEFQDVDFTDNIKQQSKQSMQLLKKLSIGKYNNLRDGLAVAAPTYQPDAVLVLGQVENDRSITCNKSAVSTNGELIAHAIASNPGKSVFFKQHPDCLGERSRPGFVDLSGNDQIIELDRQLTIFEAISVVDIVYTISSLGGFEALMHKKKVITFGCPFYAGWGLTTDYEIFPRRNRKLSIMQLFYIAYICYPTYFNPESGKQMTMDQVVGFIAGEIS